MFHFVQIVEALLVALVLLGAMLLLLILLLFELSQCFRILVAHNHSGLLQGKFQHGFWSVHWESEGDFIMENGGDRSSLIGTLSSGIVWPW